MSWRFSTKSVRASNVSRNSNASSSHAAATVVVTEVVVVVLVNDSCSGSVLTVVGVET